jgi:hypothetical protein
MLERFKERGPHPEYIAFERAASGQNIPPRKPFTTINSWNLIHDAVNGRGGFVNGFYLVPHEKEIDSNGNLIDKFWERVEATAYDNFAKTICNSPWKYITKNEDMIKRDTAETDLQEFWLAVDGRNLRMSDFLEYPALQARMYGTAWVFLDRPVNATGQAPDAPRGRRAIDALPTNRPYAYSVATRNVVDWQFDPSGQLSSITCREPLEGYDDLEEKNLRLRIWTCTGWSLFRKVDGAEWDFETGGPNSWGVVPAVPIYDEAPGPKLAMGTSVMLDTARAARQHYNLSSEKRELERKNSFAMLAMPMADPTQVENITLGNQRVLGFSDKSSSPPVYVESTLTAFDKIVQDMKDTKEAAYAAADMAAMMGFANILKTSSGFHEEAVFERTNTRIGKFASSLERGETEIAQLFRVMLGRPRDPKAVHIDYPRDFGLRDLAAMQARTDERLAMRLGVDDATKTILDFYTALYPRTDQKELEAEAKTAAQEYYKNNPVQSATPPNPLARVQTILTNRARFASATGGAPG